MSITRTCQVCSEGTSEAVEFVAADGGLEVHIHYSCVCGDNDTTCIDLSPTDAKLLSEFLAREAVHAVNAWRATT